MVIDSNLRGHYVADVHNRQLTQDRHVDNVQERRLNSQFFRDLTITANWQHQGHLRLPAHATEVQWVWLL